MSDHISITPSSIKERGAYGFCRRCQEYGYANEHSADCKDVRESSPVESLPSEPK